MHSAAIPIAEDAVDDLARPHSIRMAQPTTRSSVSYTYRYTVVVLWEPHMGQAAPECGEPGIGFQQLVTVFIHGFMKVRGAPGQ